MKIAVNTRFLLHQRLEGIGMYTQEILRRVVRLLPEHEFLFCFDRPYHSSFIFAPNVRPIVVAPPARHPFLWYWWFEHSLPAVLKREKANLLLSPDGYASLSTDVPQLLTIHDLAFEHYPEQVPFLVRHYYRHYTPLFCRKAAKILAVSEFTRQDIIRQYHIAPEKIKVVYNGYSPEASASPTTAKTFDFPYFLYIGAIHPRKNILSLLQAFESLHQQHSLPHRLILAGRNAWMNEELSNYRAQMIHRDKVLQQEELSRHELISLLRNATALVYPSFFEGFGIPVLEAMSEGVPVITSNVSALPEIAGDAALLVDPGSPDAIAQAMYRLVTSKEIQETCIQKGLDRASIFSWDRSAEQVAEQIRLLLAQG